MKIERILFMGTPVFAVPCLEKLINEGMKPILCVTQPDKPRGRKQKLQAPEVKKTAIENSIPCIQPHDVNSDQVYNKIERLCPQIIVTVAYGGFIKRRLRKLPEFGSINLHPSLLPRYRGSSPINAALFNGDRYTGNTVFRLISRMDAGPILYQTRLEIGKTENFTELSARLARDGAESILECLELISSGKAVPVDQEEAAASYCHKLTRSDLLLDWSSPAEVICNRIRGLALKPGATASFRGRRIKIISSRITKVRSAQKPGLITDIIKNEGIMVATEDYDLLIREVQPAGKNIMTANAFSLGARIKGGESFETGF